MLFLAWYTFILLIRQNPDFGFRGGVGALFAILLLAFFDQFGVIPGEERCDTCGMPGAPNGECEICKEARINGEF